MTSSNVIKQNSTELSQRSDIYSHTAKVPGLIFCSGQVPADSQGKIVDGDVKQHCAQCINNLEKALKNAGSSLDHLVKVNVSNAGGRKSILRV
jgi:enamine deaminase RidA (YjgF/YER057c/UK114 family)